MKIKPKTITITRAEGLTSECGTPALALNWSEANAILHRWGRSAPRDGSYHKCDFQIVFEDGNTYSGRYDLKHWSVESPDLSGHVGSFVSYLAGTPPAWMRGDRAVLANYEADIAANPARVAQAKQWLETYALSDYEVADA